MKHLIAQEHHSVSEIREKITSIKGYNHVIDWKIIQCIKTNPCIEASEIARVFCLSQQKVYQVIQQYNKIGARYKLDKQWGGRRKERSYISLEVEKELLEGLRKKALNGLILTARDIKKEFEKQIGKSLSDDYIWDVFKRHNWSKKAPRPEHPKTDYDKQEEFKKNFQKTWQPPS
jgi:transposase